MPRAYVFAGRLPSPIGGTRGSSMLRPMNDTQRPLAGLWLTGLPLAEAAGIAGVALAYALIDRGRLAPPFAWVLLAGAWEGLCLGGAQAAVLRPLGARPAPWVALTVAGATAGYGLSLLGGAGGGGGGPEPPLWLMTLAGAGAGVAMGALLGALQSLALPPPLRARSWIAANALGWAVAMAVIMTGAGMVGSDWSLGAVVLTGAASGALAGLAVALATLPLIQKRRIAR